jgi:hypothetical protein
MLLCEEGVSMVTETTIRPPKSVEEWNEWDATLGEELKLLNQEWQSLHDPQTALSQNVIEARKQEMVERYIEYTERVHDWLAQTDPISQQAGLARLEQEVKSFPPRTVITPENNPDFHAYIAQLNDEANKRFGTEFPVPTVVINPTLFNIANYIAIGDVIELGNGYLSHAGALVAHELIERRAFQQNPEQRYLALKWNVHNKLGLPHDTETIEKLRAHECREDFESALLAGKMPIYNLTRTMHESDIAGKRLKSEWSGKPIDYQHDPDDYHPSDTERLKLFQSLLDLDLNSIASDIQFNPDCTIQNLPDIRAKDGAIEFEGR